MIDLRQQLRLWRERALILCAMSAPLAAGGCYPGPVWGSGEGAATAYFAPGNNGNGGERDNDNPPPTDTDAPSAAKRDIAFCSHISPIRLKP